jgi:hypothetical protein
MMGVRLKVVKKTFHIRVFIIGDNLKRSEKFFVKNFLIVLIKKVFKG